ncbi:MAG: TolC family protein [Gemmatimonadota bacterium]
MHNRDIKCLGFAGFAVMVAVALPARAQDTLTLARAVAMARTANPRVAGASAEVAAAGARIRPAGTLPDPTLTIGAMNYMLPSLSASRDPLSMNQVTLTQMLPVNGTLGLRRTVARFDSVRVASQRDALMLSVERGVRARYWDLYHTDRALEIMDRTLAVVRELSNVATTMYTVGSTVQSDVVRAQVAVTRMQQEIIEMRLQRFAAASAFNALLGRPGEAPLVLPAPPGHEGHGAATLPLETPPLPPFDSLVALADTGNPDIAAGRAGVEGARTNETAIRRMIYPDLDLGMAYGQRVGDNDMLSLMVGVSVPVFARSRQFRMRDEARAMRNASEEMLRAMRLEVRSMLATAYQEAETARRQVALYAGSLNPQAVAAYEAALSAYRVGRVDFPTVLDAQMALLTYQHDLHRYEAMYGTAVAEIDRLIGRPFAAPAANQ